VTYPTRSNRHFIVGVLILLVGVVLLLDQIGFVAANEVFKFWPLILIYFGVNRVTRNRGTVGWFWGGFLILLGISFQLQELGLSHIRIEVIWPVFLICAGILLIVNRYGNRSRWDVPPTPGPPADFPPAPTPGPPPGSPPGTPPPWSAPEAASVPGGASATGAPADAPPSGAPPSGAPNYAPPFGAPSQTHSNFAAGPGPDWHGAKPWSDFHRRMDEMSDNIHRGWGDRSHSSETSAPRLNEVNIFWGGKRRIVAKNFVGGEIVSIFGGFDIDLREADMLGNVVEIEVVAIFGGGDIRIPPNWEVVMETVGIFGGCGDRTRHPENPNIGAPGVGGAAAPQTKKLIIKGVAIFGGMNVKN
jgi:hypothetical protein